ncbi:RNA exonuclease 4 isoform X2 [Cinnamomum micranthum f. kanehirae]|uniref:RNA exonuclease 4 n=1 Tax=Cinnamomum micranthum f. kanehirae TaxID=337451 RepID=A0A443PFT4_9MAGN|nr:RNA exonuclease 4 isoform X2 [Cinnamomum micranthum f. kanehirae]
MGVEAADPKRSLNPNWAQLQQKLKIRSTKEWKGFNPKSEDKSKTPQSTLGKRKERSDSEPDSAASLLIPTNIDCSLTDAIAMDCEMVGVSSQGNKSAVGRVTLVNAWGNVVYDEYVRPLEYIVDFRSAISGIRPHHLRKAKDFKTVQKKVAEMIKGRILVGHALHNDLKVLLLSHPKKDTRDTSEYQPFLREGKRRALRDLAAQFLGVKIQENEHCPIDDARAAMLIYQKHKKEWERNIKKNLRFKQKHKKNKQKHISKERDSAELDHTTTS